MVGAASAIVIGSLHGGGSAGRGWLDSRHARGRARVERPTGRGLRGVRLARSDVLEIVVVVGVLATGSSFLLAARPDDIPTETGWSPSASSSCSSRWATSSGDGSGTSPRRRPSRPSSSGTRSSGRSSMSRATSSRASSPGSRGTSWPRPQRCVPSGTRSLSSSPPPTKSERTRARAAADGSSRNASSTCSSRSSRCTSSTSSGAPASTRSTSSSSAAMSWPTSSRAIASWRCSAGPWRNVA